MASAPGKLILFGEHAVVDGRPALAGAVSLRLAVQLQTVGGSAAVHLDLPQLPHQEETSWAAVRAYTRAARERWEAYARDPSPEGFRAVRGDDPAHLVKVALGEAADELGDASPPGLRLTGRSLFLPVGSGLGSSAAMAVAVAAAYLLWRGGSVKNPGDLERVERVAREAERRQHGLPSGIDAATVLHGGLLWAQKTASGGLATERVVVRNRLLADRLHVFDTGTPAEATGAVVAAVRQAKSHDPARHERLLDGIEAATRGFREEIERKEYDPERVRELIVACEACLEELGVVPAEVRALVRKIETEGGAAKISGAGSLRGPGAGALLVYHPDSERIAAWPFLRTFRRHPLTLGASGLRQEPHA